MEFRFRRLRWRTRQCDAKEHVLRCCAFGGIAGLALVTVICALTHTPITPPPVLMFGFFLFVIYGLRAGTAVYNTEECLVTVLHDHIVVKDADKDDVFILSVTDMTDVLYRFDYRVLTVRGAFLSKKRGRRKVLHFLCQRDDVDRFLSAVRGMDGVEGLYVLTDTRTEEEKHEI